jgi:hypothetical protein
MTQPLEGIRLLISQGYYHCPHCGAWKPGR